jgi:cobaltochelatase CobN
MLEINRNRNVPDPRVSDDQKILKQRNMKTESTIDQNGSALPPGVFTEVPRFDGELKTVRVVEGQIFVCKGCCCGNVERNQPTVPLDCFKKEWKERGIRRRVHLTITGCLGPCVVPNVVLFVYQGSTVWFHSINSDSDVLDIYDYVETLLAAGGFSLPGGRLAGKVFQRYMTDSICTLGEIENEENDRR